jgi:four helix bundle protein
MIINRFEELPIRKLALKITKEVYDISAKEKFSKDYWLRDQIRRAIVSVSSNIVEGYEKSNNNEFVRFLKIAKWSCWEARNQLFIGLVIGYITQQEFDNTNESLLNLSKQIAGFIKYLEEHKKLKDKK